MNQGLPDVATTGGTKYPAPLDWVGMQNIDVPLQIDEPSCHPAIAGQIDAEVNLPTAQVRGIHMSRLYRLVDRLGEQPAIRPEHVVETLGAMIASQEQAASTSARLRIRFPLLAQRGALVTPAISGWTRYPISIEAEQDASGTMIRTTVDVTYSSTCPCSASLARELVAEAFAAEFTGPTDFDVVAATEWVRRNATLATPHSQRSIARIQFETSPNAKHFELMDVIDAAEDALQTPVQTVVKRPDEQAFAQRNGDNLMFVEDAARVLRNRLATRYGRVVVSVNHMESLHPHDAVATASAEKSSVA